MGKRLYKYGFTEAQANACAREGGATLINRNNPNTGPGGMTLGNYILGTNLQANTDDVTFMHEYGHTLQSGQWGPLYLVPAILSGSDMLFGGWRRPWSENRVFINHDIRWYETEANRKAARYFAKHYGIGWDDRRNPRLV
ncbi:MAG: hypothetical protein EOO43_02655 [Flavobacterium sp.]|nr:MAG: hypothetical protein EOO43_02655 [Flavobacterium sp.]